MGRAYQVDVRTPFLFQFQHGIGKLIRSEDLALTGLAYLFVLAIATPHGAAAEEYGAGSGAGHQGRLLTFMDDDGPHQDLLTYPAGASCL